MSKLTRSENKILYHLAEAWNLFINLPSYNIDEREMDVDEFRHGVHALQNMILARPECRRLEPSVDIIYCKECDVNPVGKKGELCSGCEAYREHTGQI